MKKKSAYFKIFITLVLSVFFVSRPLCYADDAVKQKNSKTTKQSKRDEIMKQFIIKSPDNIHSVVFSRPIASMAPDIQYWGKIEIYHTSKGRIHTVEDPSVAGDDAFQQYGDDAWSPDGRYIAVWKIGDAETGKAIIGFLDVCKGTWEGFESKTKSATTDNFTGWREDKPHTMLLIGEPPKWRNYLEALPINELFPDECK